MFLLINRLIYSLDSFPFYKFLLLRKKNKENLFNQYILNNYRQPFICERLESVKSKYVHELNFKKKFKKTTQADYLECF
jgi:hypothetical protein